MNKAATSKARGRTGAPKIIDCYMGGKINIDDQIMHTIRLDGINKGFDLMHEGESIRSAIVFDRIDGCPQAYFS